MLRLAITNIYRPGALTPSVVMSLGLGLTVLVTITQIDGNLRRQFMAALPDRAPSFYFIDIPTNDADRFGDFLKQTAPQSTVEDVPMLRGRIVAARGVKAEDLNASSDSEWVLQSDRGLTYTGEIPEGIEDRRGQMVGRRLQRPAAGLDREEDRRRARTSNSAIPSSSMCSAATSPPPSATCARWTGRASASISCWCSRPTPSRARPHTHIATLTETHPDPSGDAQHHQIGRRRLSDGDQRPGPRGAGDHRHGGDQSGDWRSAAPARSP